MDVLIPKPCNEAKKGLLEPLKIMYHKEKVGHVPSEISLFTCKNTKIAPQNYNFTIRASGSKEEMGDKLERVASCDEAEEK